MSLFDSARPNPAGFREVTAAEVPVPAQGFRVIDVREPAELLSGRIPGVSSVPLASVTAQAVNWNKDEVLLMVCQGGARSARAAQALLQLGFPRVMNLVGGMNGWAQAGKPVEK